MLTPLPSAPQVLAPIRYAVDQVVVQGVVLATILCLGLMWNKLARLDAGLKEGQLSLDTKVDLLRVELACDIKEGQKDIKEGLASLDTKVDLLRVELARDIKEGLASLDAKLDAKMDRLRAELAQDRLLTLGVVGLGGMALYAVLKPPR